MTSTGADYDFTTNVTGDLTLTANWKRSTTEYVGAQTYKFEAEDIDFTGIIGAGLSGTTTEAGAIVTKPGFNASGDKFVSYMYKRGNTLKFEVISDVAKTVTLKASMSQEIENYSYNKDNYQIMANGKIWIMEPSLSVMFLQELVILLILNLSRNLHWELLISRLETMNLHL